MTHPPNAVSEAQFQPPAGRTGLAPTFTEHNLLSRVCGGARLCLFVGLVGTAVSLVIGVLWGAIAGYCGGRWDAVMMRFVDVLYSMPSIIFVIVLIATCDALLGKCGAPFRRARCNGCNSPACLAGWARFPGCPWRGSCAARSCPCAAPRLRGREPRPRGGPRAVLLRPILRNVYGVIIVYLTMTIPCIIL